MDEKLDCFNSIKNVLAHSGIQYKYVHAIQNIPKGLSINTNQTQKSIPKCQMQWSNVEMLADFIPINLT